jgi:hypothetical protein
LRSALAPPAIIIPEAAQSVKKSDLAKQLLCYYSNRLSVRVRFLIDRSVLVCG